MRGSGGRLDLRRRFAVRRQGDGEGRAFAGPAGHRDVAAEELAEAPGNRQAEAGAAVFFGRGRIGLRERLEQPAELLLGHADAGVGDGKAHHRPVGLETLRHQSEAAVLGELAAVAEDIEQALLELGAVGMHAAEVLGRLELERIAVLLGQRNDQRPHLFEQRHDFDVFEEDVHLAGFDLRQVENVVDQAEQVTAGAFDLLQVATDIVLSEIGDVFLEDLAVADDGVERRAQLVAHIGEELRLVLARDLELAALVLDFVEQPRVLDRQHRLRREGLDQIDGVLRKGAGRAAADHQHADDVVAAEQRRRQPRAETGAQADLVDLVGGLLAQIGDLRSARAAQSPPR